MPLPIGTKIEMLDDSANQGNPEECWKKGERAEITGFCPEDKDTAEHYMATFPDQSDFWYVTEEEFKVVK